MIPLPGDLLTRIPVDAAVVRRIYEDNPFFRARADRHAQLDEAIRVLESSPEAMTTGRKFLIMLKKRRDDMVIELIDMVANATPATHDALWRVPPSEGQGNDRPTRSWRWP